MGITQVAVEEQRTAGAPRSQADFLEDKLDTQKVWKDRVFRRRSAAGRLFILERTFIEKIGGCLI